MAKTAPQDVQDAAQITRETYDGLNALSQLLKHSEPGFAVPARELGVLTQALLVELYGAVDLLEAMTRFGARAANE